MQRESVARAVKLEPSIALFDAVPAVPVDRPRPVQTVQRSGRVRTPIARRAAGRSPPHRPADSTLEPSLPAACERVIRPLPLPVAHISQKGAESGHGRGNVEQNKNVGCFTFWFCGKVALCPGIAVHGASLGSVESGECASRRAAADSAVEATDARSVTDTAPGARQACSCARTGRTSGRRRVHVRPGRPPCCRCSQDRRRRFVDSFAGPSLDPSFGRLGRARSGVMLSVRSAMPIS